MAAPIKSSALAATAGVALLPPDKMEDALFRSCRPISVPESFSLSCCEYMYFPSFEICLAAVTDSRIELELLRHDCPNGEQREHGRPPAIFVRRCSRPAAEEEGDDGVGVPDGQASKRSSPSAFTGAACGSPGPQDTATPGCRGTASPRARRRRAPGR